MKIKRNLIERIDIADFAERHDLTIVVRERNINDMNELNIKDSFYAYFEGAEIKRDACLSSDFGGGNSEEGAISDYANRISGRLLVFNAYGRDRHEIQAPYLSYSPKKRGK